MNTAQNGLWAGLLATGPMTLAMFALQRNLPALEKSPLPPATLTSQITSAVGLDQKLSQNPRENLTLLSHFAYGAASGVLYSTVFKNVKMNPIIKGALFGSAVWAGSYLGWIPSVGLRARAFNMPQRRNGMMILSHLVWGLSLAFAEKELRHAGNQMLDGHKKALKAE